jgi:hypothetical protein
VDIERQTLSIEGLRSRRGEPAHDLQLDGRWQGSVRAHRRRVGPHLRRLLWKRPQETEDSQIQH